MNDDLKDIEDPRLAEMLDVIFKFAAGDLAARGTIAGDNSALDGVMAGINILGEELEAQVAENKRTLDALAESEAQFRAVFNAVGEGILVADVNTRRFRMVNNSICHMLGYSCAELFKLSVDDIHPEEDLPNVNHQFERQVKGEITLATLPVKRKDGSVFYADINASPVALGGQDYLIGVFRDITERMLAEEQIRKLNDELQEKVQQLLEAQDELVRKEKLSTLGQVAGSVGHELRNPLGVMNNAVYFLQTVLSDADDTIREYLRIIKDEIGNADRIVGDLLDSVRTKPPQRQRVMVESLIEPVLHTITVPDGIRVITNLPATLPPLQVDPAQVQQVFRNLISNGIDAMPNGGNLEITALEDAAHKGLEVKIGDSGIGIAPEHIAKLFQPLFTTKAGGIGLGLVVVKNLTENNGGGVAVESEPGKGTLFTVTLPLACGPT